MGCLDTVKSVLSGHLLYGINMDFEADLTLILVLYCILLLNLHATHDSSASSPKLKSLLVSIGKMVFAPKGGRPKAKENFVPYEEAARGFGG